jgi:precorrin-3B synthase
MSAPIDLRRGWCPSVARPMPSGDGLLMRLNLPCGALPMELARGIAECARRFGNGLIDLTRHGNVQLRGVREATLPALQTRLCELLPSLAHEQPDAARNIIASPLAGLDAHAICDTRPIVAALQERLTSDRTLWALPAKFSFLIDDGSELGLDDIAADIRFEALLHEGQPRFAVALGGSLGSSTPIGSCAASELAETAAALAGAFLELRGNDNEAPRRMSTLVRRVGARVLSTRARSICPQPLCGQATSSKANTDRAQLIGFHHLDADFGFLAIGAPFGRLDADQLDHLADGADEGQAELRVTPWRAVLIGRIDEKYARRLRPSLAGMGMIAQADDGRLAVAACPGAPACTNASVRTREDAGLLAPFAHALSQRPDGIGLHISGCLKGCAKSDAAPVTLVGRGGRYDVVLDGRAADPPSHVALTAEEVKALLLQSQPRGDAVAMIGNAQ